MEKNDTHSFTERSLRDDKVLSLNLFDKNDQGIVLKIGKALGNIDCVRVFSAICEKPMNMIELSKYTNLPISSVSNHIDTLKEAQLIFVSYQPGIKGHAKICSKQITNCNISFNDLFQEKTELSKTYEINVGTFSDCKVSAPCGMASSEKALFLDNPAMFFSPDRNQAELLWFSQGFVTYKFPNETKENHEISEVSFTMEICSEAIYYRENYPSDITIIVNDVELTTWTSPGDFGGRRGTYSPSYWSVNSTQYGKLKKFSINKRGVFIDDELVNNSISIKDIHLEQRNDIKLTIKIKDDAIHKGGINIFGKNFGDYNKSITMTIQFDN